MQLQKKQQKIGEGGKNILGSINIYLFCDIISPDLKVSPISVISNT